MIQVMTTTPNTIMIIGLQKFHPEDLVHVIGTEKMRILFLSHVKFILTHFYHLIENVIERLSNFSAWDETAEIENFGSSGLIKRRISLFFHYLNMRNWEELGKNGH